MCRIHLLRKLNELRHKERTMIGANPPLGSTAPTQIKGRTKTTKDPVLKNILSKNISSSKTKIVSSKYVLGLENENNVSSYFCFLCSQITDTLDKGLNTLLTNMEPNKNMSSLVDEYKKISLELSDTSVKSVLETSLEIMK